MSRYGPDWSDYQGNPDVDAVATVCSFAVQKATEGEGFVASTFATNRAAIAGKDTLGFGGIYHFARPENGRPVQEADHACDVVGSLGPKERLIVDVETGTVLAAAAQLKGHHPELAISPSAVLKLHRSEVQVAKVAAGEAHPAVAELHSLVAKMSTDWPAYIEAFQPRAAERLGKAGLTYMSQSPAGTMPASVAAWDLWVAGYPGGSQWPEWADFAVGPWATPVMWQFTDAARIPGVAGACDLSVAPDDLLTRLGIEEDLEVDEATRDSIIFQGQLLNDLKNNFFAVVGDGDYALGMQRCAQVFKRLAASAGGGQ